MRLRSGPPHWAIIPSYCLRSWRGEARGGAGAPARRAASLGYHPLVLSSELAGEAREVASVLVAVAREVKKRNRPVPAPACLLWGGETTVTVRGKGRGGGHPEMA